MAALLDTLKDLWSSAATHYVAHDVPRSAVTPPADTGECCVAGLHYFRLWLAEMRLAHGREWFTAQHPLVHSLVRLQFGDQELELPRVCGPLGLPGFDAAHLGDVIHLDHPLTPLLPYNGGVVEVSAGLIGLEGSSVLRDFVSAVDAVSQVLAPPPLSSVVAAVMPVTRAVQALLGASDGRQHLGIHLAYAGQQSAQALHAGFVAVIRRDALTIDTGEVSVDRGRLRYRGQPLTGADYLLFRVERMAERDDWDGLSSVARPFRDALAALSHGNTPTADALVRRALLEAFTSPDLTRTDRPRVAGEIKRAYQEARDAGLGLAHETATLSSAMAGAAPPDDFARAQPPSLDALLDLGN
jgi:hypothetical protein